MIFGPVIGGARPGGVVPGRVPPWIAPPADARTVDHTSDWTLVLALTSVEILREEVPEKLRLVVTMIEFDAQDPTDLVKATFTVFAGDNPYAGYHHIPAPSGSIAGTARAFIHIDRGLPLSITVENGFPLLDCYYRARIFGWLYDPERDA